MRIEWHIKTRYKKKVSVVITSPVIQWLSLSLSFQRIQKYDTCVTWNLLPWIMNWIKASHTRHQYHVMWTKWYSSHAQEIWLIFPRMARNCLTQQRSLSQENQTCNEYKIIVNEKEETKGIEFLVSTKTEMVSSSNVWCKIIGKQTWKTKRNLLSK